MKKREGRITIRKRRIWLEWEAAGKRAGGGQNCRSGKAATQKDVFDRVNRIYRIPERARGRDGAWKTIPHKI